MKVCNHKIPGTPSVATPYYSVTNSPPVYSTLPITFPLLRTLFMSNDYDPTRLAPEYDALLRIIFYYGLRARELLTATVPQVYGADHLYIYGSKGSRDCTIYMPGIIEHAAKCKAVSNCPFLFHVNYLDLYRACCRAGIRAQVTGHTNLARVHAGRRYSATEVFAIAGAPAITDVLRHRSVRSQLYYQPTRGVSNG